MVNQAYHESSSSSSSSSSSGGSSRKNRLISYSRCLCDVMPSGWKNAEAVMRQGTETGWDLDKFKWFFNYMTFEPGELDREVEDDDMWDVMEVEPALVLKQGVALEKSLW